MRSTTLSLAFAAMVVLCARDLRADSTNCREGVLVETGYSTREVYDKCGMPSRRVTAVGGNPRSEHWVYAPAGFHPRLLQFYDGVLQRIRVIHGPFASAGRDDADQLVISAIRAFNSLRTRDVGRPTSASK